MARHRIRLAANAYTIGSGSFQPWLSVARQPDGSLLATLDWEVEGTHLYYHTGDGKFQRYSGPFAVSKDSEVTVMAFYHGLLKEKAYRLKVDGNVK